MVIRCARVDGFFYCVFFVLQRLFFSKYQTKKQVQIEK